MRNILGAKIYNFLEKEKKWHTIWAKNKLFEADNNSDQQPFSMVLSPTELTHSLHTGQVLTLIIPDIILRRKKMQGFNTLWIPIIDNVGIVNQIVVEKNLREELTIVKDDCNRKQFPRVVRNLGKNSEKKIIKQVHTLGLSLDWSRKKSIFSPEMDKIVSRAFVQLFKEGKIFRRKQWFLKAAEIAEPAINAVERGKIKFTPEKGEKIYLKWMTNIRDWCLSSKSCWGHKIPAYNCSNCGKFVVQEEKPEKCSECDSIHITQEQDVLDTWFSNALWPLLTLGWDKNSKDFVTFYPTNLITTRFNMIYSWVTRMITMGIHCGKDIPVREVLINGFIRNETGEKLCGSDNSPSAPPDLIGEYGADAVRFTLAAQAAPGMDIMLSINRIKGYKAFLNKIWNASRFILMKSKGDENVNFDLNKITTTDKWMLHFLNKTIEKVNELMDNYRINKAANLLYHFFWHEYCDWYLEFSKKNIENPDTRRALRFILLKLLQLLHPFIPFITEEIYQEIKTDKDFLLQTDFPSFNSDLIFPDEFSKMELLKKVIKAARKTRTENRIDPNRRINIYLKTESKKEKNMLFEEIKYFDFLARSARTEIVPDFEAVQKGFKGSCPNWEILLPFDNENDRLSELNRLKKELKHIENRIVNIEKTLANQEYVSKAPQSKTANLKKSLQGLINKKEKIKKTIGDLS